jgi:hypothetical protein
MPTMRCFRGEKSQWWPAPNIRLMEGMTVFEPWEGMVPDLWRQLQADIVDKAGGSVNAYAQYLRATGRPFALATARSAGGAFEFDYNYIMEIENARCFLWAGDTVLQLGAAADGFVTHPDTINAHYIVLDAATIERSSVLGFGHHTGTREVTFFHGLPLELVRSCNGAPITRASVTSPAHLDLHMKMKWQKIHKRIQQLRAPTVSAPAQVPAPRVPPGDTSDLSAQELMAYAAARFRAAHYGDD